jgi:hypothetical protein
MLNRRPPFPRDRCIADAEHFAWLMTERAGSGIVQLIQPIRSFIFSELPAKRLTNYSRTLIGTYSLSP